ncbi:DUF3455 domain-containing protein [Streptomyces sp. NPDC051907]|uniref:DUF3455 domain-containing protein n=1 Tax=Streptomyces sp. NPDC051907 TaxID=3155284 RepID=UPI00343A58C9
MSRKRKATGPKKAALLVAGVGLVSVVVAVTTGSGFASQAESQQSGGTRSADAAKAAGERVFRSPVKYGVQIYACTQQADGAFAFTQRGVRAVLKGGIKHSFVNPDSGPPQWIARDGSAVTGKIISRTPHGEGNIPELVLSATQTGKPTGKLSQVTEIRRVETSGGVAPAGPCDPSKTPTEEVPYQAVYEFVSPARPASPSTAPQVN